MPQTLNQAGAFIQGRGPASLGLLPQSCPPRGPHQARAADSAAAGLESPSRDQGCDRTPGSREPAQPPPHRRRDGGLGLGDSAAAGTSSAGTSRSPWRSPDTPRPRCAAQNRAGTDRVPRNLGGRLQIPRWWSDDVSGTKAPARPQKPAPYSRSLRLIARFSSRCLRLDRASVLTGSDPE